jgi:excisionase family DNA binding protein
LNHYYTVKEVSEEICVSENTIRIWLRDGKLSGIRIGNAWRIPKRNLENFMFERREGENKYLD